MSYLDVNNLQAEYDSFKLELSFSLEKSEFVSIIGPSGCGKSTTLSLLAGLLKPQSGKIILDGKDITELPSQKRKIGMVFQDYALFPHFNVAKNIAYALELQGIKGKEQKHQIKKYLEFVHLSGFEKRKIDTLSGGEKQRVALARSIAACPNLLLLDEPLSALDASLRRQLRSEIKSIQIESQTPFIYVTHDREEAFSLSDRILVMNNGKLEDQGTPEELYAHPKTLFSALFTGDGTVVDSGIFFNDIVGKKAFFRPEQVQIRDTLTLFDSDYYLLLEDARILGYDFQGSSYLLGIDWKGNKLLALSPKKPDKSIVSLAILKKSIVIFEEN